MFVLNRIQIRTLRTFLVSQHQIWSYVRDKGFLSISDSDGQMNNFDRCQTKRPKHPWVLVEIIVHRLKKNVLIASWRQATESLY